MSRVLILQRRLVTRCATPKLRPRVTLFGRYWPGVAARAPWLRRP